MTSQVSQKIMNYEADSNLVIQDSNKLIWFQPDTFHYVSYTSAIRTRPHWDTLEISLHFEAGWSKELIEETKKQNMDRINALKKVYVAFMDSIDWRGYKITKSGFNSNVVKHLKMKYPVNFTAAEREEIDSIKRCPNYLVGNIGVFADCSYTRINPIEVQQRFLDKLAFIQREIFNSTDAPFGKKIYQ